MTRDYQNEMRQQYESAMSAGDPSKKKVDMSFCPSTWSKPCKLCDGCKEILFHQDKNTAQKIEQARELNRKPKFYANVLLTTNPAEVLVFEYGKTIGDKLGIYEMDDSSELRGFSDPRKGRNIVIIRFPNPDKRKTRYDVEARLAISPILDMGVLDRLYNLDDIPALLKAGLQPMYQSKLTAQRTEVRWLPSWLGPKFASVFQVRYFIHYHTSEDGLAAINRGEFNPLLEENYAITTPTTVQPGSVPGPASAPYPPSYPEIVQPATIGRNLWNELGSTEDRRATPSTVLIPAPQQETAFPPFKGAEPGCMGTFDEQEPVCTVRCTEKGWVEKCKVVTEANLSKRRQARGLYR